MDFSVLLLPLSLVAIAVAAIAIHSSSSKYGLAPTLFVLAALVSVLHSTGATPIYAEVFGSQIVIADFIVIPILLTLPLIIYEANGSAATRIVISMLILFSLVIVAIQGVRVLVMQQYDSITVSQESITTLLFTFASTVALVVAFSAQVIVHQFVRNSFPRAPIIISVGCALLIAISLDEIVFRTIAFGWEGFVDRLPGGIGVKSASGLILTPIVGVYLSRFAPLLPDFVGTHNRALLDILANKSAAIDIALRESQKKTTG